MLPEFFAADMRLPQPALHDPGADARRAAAELFAGLGPGTRVAIACGSRGIRGIAGLLRNIVAAAEERKLAPYLVTAMGSHGGATVEGQLAVLAHYGVTEAAVGAPIRAGMATRRIGTTPEGVHVHWDAEALAADAVIVVNRVKPHTTLRGELGSGLAKMAVIGLGNREGAEAGHGAGLQEHLRAMFGVVAAAAPLVGGIAVIENAAGSAARIEGLPAGEWLRREPELLAYARSLMPRIPVQPLDVLIVRRMGKNISGTGMDPNIIGMHRRHGGEADTHIRTIVALGIDPRSEGNATGVGMADLITERLRGSIDWERTRVNCFTGGFLNGLKLPYALPSDRAAIAAAVAASGGPSARCAIIESTLELSRLWLSANLRDEAAAHPHLALSGGARPLAFAADGNLPPEPLQTPQSAPEQEAGK